MANPFFTAFFESALSALVYECRFFVLRLFIDRECGKIMSISFFAQFEHAALLSFELKLAAAPLAFNETKPAQLSNEDSKN
jgi:hypothetical protein